ncbi:MAG: tetratricopeptide repeat protein [Endomicrobium sp.]|jgi:predicted negative regulator of RcsB-dependent stress response|nr:tetratricopeptide repeat protein [Endomicrobium sp.]
MQKNIPERSYTHANKLTIKILALLISGGLLIAVLMCVYCFRIHRINDLSAFCLAKACSSLASGNRRLGTTLLDEVIAKYPKTPAAYQAKLFRADIFTELKHYDKALDILMNTASEAEPKSIRPLALARIIYIYDSKKDYTNAITMSKNFIAKYADHFLTKDIYLNLAEYYLNAGLKNDAVKTFTEILINFPATQEARTAQKRIDEIKK